MQLQDALYTARKELGTARKQLGKFQKTAEKQEELIFSLKQAQQSALKDNTELKTRLKSAERERDTHGYTHFVSKIRPQQKSSDALVRCLRIGQAADVESKVVRKSQEHFTNILEHRMNVY